MPMKANLWELKFAFHVSWGNIYIQCVDRSNHFPNQYETWQYAVSFLLQREAQTQKSSAIENGSVLIDLRGSKYFHFHRAVIRCFIILYSDNSRLRKCTRFPALLSFSQGWYLPNGQHPGHAPASATPITLAWSSMQTGHTSAPVREMRSQPLPH
jgi:hypothetical protein